MLYITLLKHQVNKNEDACIVLWLDSLWLNWIVYRVTSNHITNEQPLFLLLSLYYSQRFVWFYISIWFVIDTNRLYTLSKGALLLITNWVNNLLAFLSLFWWLPLILVCWHYLCQGNFFQPSVGHINPSRKCLCVCLNNTVSCFPLQLTLTIYSHKGTLS